MPAKPPTINDIPSDERPRERLLKHGAQALATAELLAILLRTGTNSENVLRLAERLLSHTGGLHGLAKTPPSQLLKLHGLGAAKVTQVMAALELGHRLAVTLPDEKPTVRRAADAAHLMMDMRYLSQEHVRIILLDSNNRVVAMPTVYIGTLNTSVLRMAELFREAIARNCPALILVHNHPEGDAAPSPEDIELTRSLVQAGALLDIHIMDHIIIGERDWCSMREMGLGFRD